jgi:hypothetical protein
MAGALAVLLVLGVELGLRYFVSVENLVPMRRVTNDELYRGARDYMAWGGQADEIFVGSSRTAEGIRAPLWRELREADTGTKMDVGVFGLPAASAPEMETMLQFGFRHGFLPKTIYYGITPVQFFPGLPNATNYQRFWAIIDYWRNRKTDPLRQHSPPNILIRNNLRDHICLLGMKRRIHEIFHIAYTQKFFPTMFLGEEHYYHLYEDELDSSLRQARKSRIGILRWEQENVVTELSERKVASLRAVAELCREHNVELILYELPLTQDIMGYYKYDTERERYWEVIGSVAEEYDLEWVPLSRLGVDFPIEYFRDLSHLNSKGAEILTRNLYRVLFQDSKTSE